MMRMLIIPSLGLFIYIFNPKCIAHPKKLCDFLLDLGYRYKSMRVNKLFQQSFLICKLVTFLFYFPYESNEKLFFTKKYSFNMQNWSRAN